MALLASLRTYNLLYYRKLPRLLGAGVKEGENTILHDALYCKTQTAKCLHNLHLPKKVLFLSQVSTTRNRHYRSM